MTKGVSLPLTELIAQRRAEVAATEEQTKEIAGKLRMDQDEQCLECGSDMQNGKGGPLCAQVMKICPKCRIALPAAS